MVHSKNPHVLVDAPENVSKKVGTNYRHYRRRRLLRLYSKCTSGRHINIL